MTKHPPTSFAELKEIIVAFRKSMSNQFDTVQKKLDGISADTHLLASHVKQKEDEKQ